MSTGLGTECSVCACHKLVLTNITYVQFRSMYYPGVRTT